MPASASTCVVETTSSGMPDMCGTTHGAHVDRSTITARCPSVRTRVNTSTSASVLTTSTRASRALARLILRPTMIPPVHPPRPRPHRPNHLLRPHLYRRPDCPPHHQPTQQT